VRRRGEGRDAATPERKKKEKRRRKKGSGRAGETKTNMLTILPFTEREGEREGGTEGRGKRTVKS
jgi:hypothetical protein